MNFILKIGKITRVEERTRSVSERVWNAVINTLMTPLYLIFGDFKGLVELWSDVYNDKELIENVLTVLLKN